ncbi:MAG: PEP-CTERM sorting domain-containing protein [Cyanobacterium sp. T60_A2020_053]|nr:PEP-CTERM sorting domain-containing protein [Cyanobacterium sp. T60_A2020_053]
MPISNQIKSIAYGVLISSFFTIALQGEAKGATLTIDDFSQAGTANDSCSFLNYGQCVYFNGTGVLTNTQTGFNEANVVGGSRQFDIAGSNLNGTTPAVIRNSANFGRSTDGQFLLIGNQGGFNSRGTATYNANGAGLNLGSGNARDFDLSAFDFFEFIFSDLDQDAMLTLNFTSDLGGTPIIQSLSQDLVAFAPSETTRTVQFDLGLFTNIDFTDIDVISFAIEGRANNLDAQFDLVQFNSAEVPEPSALIPILGLGGLILTSRRKKPNQDKNDKID